MNLGCCTKVAFAHLPLLVPKGSQAWEMLIEDQGHFLLEGERETAQAAELIHSFIHSLKTHIFGEGLPDPGNSSELHVDLVLKNSQPFVGK